MYESRSVLAMHIPGTAARDDNVCVSGDPGAPVSRNSKLRFAGVRDRTGVTSANEEHGILSVDIQDGHRVHTSNITFVISQFPYQLYKYTFGNQNYVLRVHESNQVHFSNIGP